MATDLLRNEGTSFLCIPIVFYVLMWLNKGEKYFGKNHINLKIKILNMTTKLLKLKLILSVFILLAAQAKLFSQALPPDIAKNSQFYYGVAWYPEQWDEARWQKDLDLMKQLHINVVRTGEFAWSKFQPSEDTFDFDWFTRSIDLAYKNGIYTIIGTPTASPPNWMTTKYPEVLREDGNGNKASLGGRWHYNPASPKYIEFCKKITQKMAEKYANQPGVIGWQIDNELWPFSYDDRTAKLFQQWLKEKYKTLENINAQWGTAYWSTTIFDWSEIPFTTNGQNPCLVLELQRFKSEVQKKYMDAQVEILRKTINPKQWITTNFHSDFGYNNAADLSQDLDIASFDPYLKTRYLDFNEMGFRLDRLRGFKKQSYLITETLPAYTMSQMPMDPMKTRLMVWHQVAHGSDAELFWQWRSGIGGKEQYHGNLVGQSGNLKPITKEMEQAGREFAEIGNKLIHAVPETKVAMWYTFDDQMMLPLADYDPGDVATQWYAAIRAWGADVDVISKAEDLKNYSLVFAPARYIITQDDAEKVKEACEKGTHIILGARSGRKNISNGWIEEYQPGCGLNKLLGTIVEESFAVDKERPVSISGKFTGGCKTWCEWLTVQSPDVEVLSSFEKHPWLKGRPAIVSNKVGEGSLSYIALVPEKKVFKDITGYFLKKALPYQKFQLLPEGVEKCTRSKSGKDFIFYLNNSPAAVEINVETGKDLISGKNISGTVKIDADQVVVIEK